MSDNNERWKAKYAIYMFFWEMREEMEYESAWDDKNGVSFPFQCKPIAVQKLQP